MLKVFCDDGSTAVKLAWYDTNNALQTLISENSFRSGWQVDSFGNGKVFNYAINNTQKFTFDKVSPDAITTTNIEYQYGNENLLAVHHALLQTALNPQDIEIWVTLPVSEYYTPDCQKNERNIARKKENLLRPLILNKGNVFNIRSVNVLPESLPAVLNALLADNVGELETSLVVDLGGTTLDCGAITGRLDSVSKVLGEPGIGVSEVTHALRNALKVAGSESNALIADRLIRERHNSALFQQLVNDVSKIDMVKQTIDDAIKNLSDRVLDKLFQFKGIHRIYLTGGGAGLIYPFVRKAYPAFGNKVKILDEPQTALVRAIADMNHEVA